MLTVQFQNVNGSGLEHDMTEGTEVIRYPLQYRGGELLPFAE